MEAILPGSSVDVQKLTTRTASPRSPSLTSPPVLSSPPLRQENPYSMAESEPDDGWTRKTALPQQHSLPEPQNYLQPCDDTDGGSEGLFKRGNNSAISPHHSFPSPGYGSHSADTQPRASSSGSHGLVMSLPGKRQLQQAGHTRGASGLSALSKSKTLQSRNAPTGNSKSEISGNFKNGTPGAPELTSPNSEWHRQTFSHGSRDHTEPQLVRSLTERGQPKSPPAGLYELDQGMDAIRAQWQVQSPPPPPPPDRSPPRTRPHNKRQSPLVGSNSDSVPSKIVEPGNEYMTLLDRDPSTSSVNEPKYDVPRVLSAEMSLSQSQRHAGGIKPVPTQRSSSSQGTAEISLSQSLNLPSGKPVPVARKRKPPPSQPHDYLELMPENSSDLNYDNPSDFSMFGLKPELVRNLNPDQLGMLKTMLEQASTQQTAPLSSPASPPSDTTTQQNGRKGESCTTGARELCV